MNIEQITGIKMDHTLAFNSEYAWCDENLRIHKNMLQSLEELCKTAYHQGHKLALLSGFRDYHRQVSIWEKKNTEESEILDDSGIAITNFNTTEDKFNKIARWSALPGLSRHHWGTDIDIFSAEAIENGVQVQLIQEEFDRGGPCASLNLWMQANLEKLSFYRPYKKDTGGVAPEPWHISFRPLASRYKQQFNPKALENIWRRNPWCGSEWAMANSEELISKYYY